MWWKVYADGTEYDIIRAKTAADAIEIARVKQYNELKAQHSGMVLLFRVEDFYEMYAEDTAVGVEVLGLSITTRNVKGKEPLLMAGFPHQSLETNLNKLLDSGHRVAVCDRVEEWIETPKKTSYHAIRVDLGCNGDKFWQRLRKAIPHVSRSLERNGCAVVSSYLHNRLGTLGAFEGEPSPIIDYGNEGEGYVDITSSPHEVIEE